MYNPFFKNMPKYSNRLVKTIEHLPAAFVTHAFFKASEILYNSRRGPEDNRKNRDEYSSNDNSVTTTNSSDSGPIIK